MWRQQFLYCSGYVKPFQRGFQVVSMFPCAARCCVFSLTYWASSFLIVFYGSWVLQTFLGMGLLVGKPSTTGILLWFWRQTTRKQRYAGCNYSNRLKCEMQQEMQKSQGNAIIMGKDLYLQMSLTFIWVTIQRVSHHFLLNLLFLFCPRSLVISCLHFLKGEDTTTVKMNRIPNHFIPSAETPRKMSHYCLQFSGVSRAAPPTFAIQICRNGSIYKIHFTS